MVSPMSKGSITGALLDRHVSSSAAHVAGTFPLRSHVPELELGSIHCSGMLMFIRTTTRLPASRNSSTELTLNMGKLHRPRSGASQSAISCDRVNSFDDDCSGSDDRDGGLSKGARERPIRGTWRKWRILRASARCSVASVVALHLFPSKHGDRGRKSERKARQV